MSANNSTIKNFLRNNFIKGSHTTHVSLMQPRGKFYFNKDAEMDFWEMYLEAYDKYKDSLMLGIAEKPCSSTPILVDIDVKIDDDEDFEYGEHLYSKEHVEHIIKTFQLVLSNTLENCREENLICLLLEKPVYRLVEGERSYLKNGFHLHFPNLFVEHHNQKTQIIPRVKEIVGKANMFESLGYDKSEDVIDAAAGRVPWLLYGCRKSEDQKPYKFTKAFDANCKEISLKEVFTICQLRDIRNNPINMIKPYEYYLPLLLSISPINKTRCLRNIKTGIVSPIKERLKNKKKIDYENEDIAVNMKKAKELLDIISVSRSSDRNDWMSIGWTLYNISEGSEDGLNLWLDFSQKTPELYDENVCIHEWDKMEKKDITIGTLKYFAAIDDPKEYNAFKEKYRKKFINQSLDGSHNSLAKLLYEEFGHKYVCAGYESNTWFEFVGHIWEEIEGAVTLKQKLSNEIVKIYEDKIKEIEKTKIETEDDDFAKNQADSTIKKYRGVIKNLGCSPFKNNVIKEAKEIFWDKNFKYKLNIDPWTIAFKNGVYDLKNNIFRDGRPEDCISKCMPIDYIDYGVDKNNKDVREIANYFEKVFPDKSLRKYFLDVTCETFVGGNFKKIGLLLTGEGDNSKSITQSFFEKMFGPYAVKLNTTVLTGKKLGGGSANADLARTGNGVRWVVAEEPNEEEEINNGIYKNLTGLDSYFARDLFEKGKGLREINPMYLLVIICNKLPRFKNFDIATFNRTRVIPFESTFCRPENPAPETYEEQLRQKRFPMDPEFGAKVDKLVPAFAWYLLEWRKNKTSGNLNAPEKVLAATEMYKKQNDNYRQFIDENIMEDDSKSISSNELYEILKSWWRENMPGHNIPIKMEITNYFTKRWGSQVRGQWSGYTIKRSNLSNSSSISSDIDEIASTVGVPI